VKQIPVIISIDVEPDEPEIDIALRAPWQGFVETHKYFSELRPQLKMATGSEVCFSWFLRMDPQIEFGYGSASWVIEQYREIVSDLEMKKDELGVHIHAYRWDEASRGWIEDYGDQEWVNTCVTTAFNCFQKALKRPCKSASFGDGWGSNEAIELMEGLGAEFYLSIEPGADFSGLHLGHGVTGRWPDYRSAPSHIYRPSRINFLQADARSERNMWMIPLSAGKYDGVKALRFSRLKRLVKVLGIDRQRNNECQTLRLDTPTKSFRRTVDGLFKISKASYLSLVVRSEVCARSSRRARLERNIEYLRSHPQARNFRFVTPAEAVRLVTSG
jgi:hypothetical protein